MFKWNYESPRRGAGHRGAALRRVRRLPRRLGHPGRALHGRPRAASSCGSGGACSAAAPTTGAASPCASAPTTSRRRSRDGLGDDWPIAYDDLKPYYDRLDELVGPLRQQRGPARTSPTASSCLRPRRGPTSSWSRRPATGWSVTCIPSRIAILTKPHERARRLPLLLAVRPRLQHATPSSRPPPCSCPPPSPPAGSRSHRGHGPRGHDRRPRASAPA